MRRWYLTSLVLSILLLVTALTSAAFAQRAGAATPATGDTPDLCASPSLSAFTVPSLAYVGDHPVAEIALSCAAQYPIRLALASTSSHLPVPSAVTVQPYQDQVVVPLSPEPYQGGQYTATLTVTWKGNKLSRTITVDPGLAQLQILADPAVPNEIGVNVLFTGILPAGGETVTLASDNSAVTVPATYTFPAGSLGGGVIPVTVSEVTVDTTVTISASLSSTALQQSYTLLAPFTSSDSLTVSAENGSGIVYGQDSGLEYLVTLSNPAPDSGTNVTLSSADPSLEIQAPNTNFISSGFTTAGWFADVANVPAPVHTTLTAAADNGVTATLPVTIEPGLASFGGIPATIKAGSSFTATVNLAGPVDTPTTVALDSSIGVLSVPLSVVVPAGQSSVSFTATTAKVTTDTPAFITASLGTTSLYSDTVTITP